MTLIVFYIITLILIIISVEGLIIINQLFELKELFNDTEIIKFNHE